MTAFSPEWAWELLDIGPHTDQRGIKRAYSRLLKLNRPEDDASAFQALHQAYQAALAYVREPGLAVAGEPDSEAVTGTPQRLPTMASPSEAHPVLENFVLDDPQVQAQTIWRRFIELPAHLINERMALLRTDEAMLGFATRDAVELLALQTAADPACEPRLRQRLAEHFDWETGMSHLERHASALCAMAGEQLRADRGLEQLQEQQGSDEALPYLLAPTVPHGLGRTGDKGFHRNMRARIESMRWQYPDVIEHRLVPDVFAWWENYALTKRYFVQTGMWSFAAGVVLFFLVQWPFTFSTAGLLGVFAACVSVTCGAVALLVLRPPQGPQKWYAALRRSHFDAILHERRYEQRWQHGWMTGLLLASPLLVLEAPSAFLPGLVAAVLTICAALSLFAASATIPPARIYLALLAAAIGGFIMQHSGFEQFAYACYPFCTCIAVLSAQSGAPLYELMRLGGRGRLLARVVWLVSIGLLCMAESMLEVSPTIMTMMAMLLLLAGVILARAAFRPAMAWPAFVILKVGAFSQSGRGTILSSLHPQLAFLAALLAIVSIFLIVNMLSDETD